MRLTMRRILHCLTLTAVCALSATAAAQSSTPGPAIDVEIFNSTDGTNSFCAAPGDTFWAYVYISPATGGASSFQCFTPCGLVQGGPANIAAATIDVAFDPTHLAFHSAFNNGFMGAAAADGMLRLEALGTGRLGWVLAGDWTPDGDTAGTLADPCEMGLLDQSGWIVRFAFTVQTSGSSDIVLRDEPAFPLAFADICGSPTFSSATGDIDEVLSATVSSGSPACPELNGIIFRNGFEIGDLSAWQ